MRKFRLVTSVALVVLLATALGAKAQQQAPQPQPHTNAVFIAGEVTAPGLYELKPTEGVPELIARAGGPTPDAALTRLVVCQGGTSITMNVAAAIRRHGAAPNFPLRDGDYVVVPRNPRRVYVIGEVAKPGSFSIPEEGMLSVAQALALAGGLRLNRTSVKVIVLRQLANGGFEQHEVLTNADDPKFNEPLQSGDAVMVKSVARRFEPRQAPPSAHLWLLKSRELSRPQTSPFTPRRSPRCARLPLAFRAVHYQNHLASR